MLRLGTAIVHLHEAGPRVERRHLEALLRPVPGVYGVECCPDDSLVAIKFDTELTGLAEIVRSIEDDGTIVTGVAQRTLSPEPTPRRLRQRAVRSVDRPFEPMMPRDDTWVAADN